MPRPNKLKVPTREFNCILRLDQYQGLLAIAHARSAEQQRQVSIADLIRAAIDAHLGEEIRHALETV